MTFLKNLVYSLFKMALFNREETRKRHKSHKETFEKRKVKSVIPNNLPAVNDSLFHPFQTSEEYKSLTPSQKKAIDLFLKGENLFITGEAGTGKSHVTKVIFDLCQFYKVAAAKTSSTGVSAFNIGGQTLHSWAGLGLADEPLNNLISKLRKNKKAIDRIVKTKVLFIDEISMVKADLLEKFDGVMRYYRGSAAPFGGVQLVMVGDMLQLSPVWRGSERKDWCFKSLSWEGAEIKTVILREKMRQNAETPFAKLLSNLRVGKMDGIEILEDRIDAKFPDDGIMPVRVLCKNVDVDQFNFSKLNAIKNPSRKFYSHDNGSPHHIEQFNKNCPAAAVIELKVGAQVILLANLDVKQGFVNGSVGIVEGFTSAGIEVRFKTGVCLVPEFKWEIKEQSVGFDGKTIFKSVASREQFPLKLAYALTVHRVQGLTLDRAYVDVGEAFAEGMLYVALSRVRDIESLSIAPFPKSALRVSRECLEFYKKLEE